MPKQIKRDGFASDRVFTAMPKGIDPRAAQEERQREKKSRGRVALENLVEPTSGGGAESCAKIATDLAMNEVAPC